MRSISLLAGMGLMLGLSSGCPAQPSCPNCGFKKASFTVQAGDKDMLVGAVMHTESRYPAGECPSTGCTRTADEDVTCVIESAAAGSTVEVALDVDEDDDLTHTVTIEVDSRMSRTINATVSLDRTPPPRPNCP